MLNCWYDFWEALNSVWIKIFSDLEIPEYLDYFLQTYIGERGKIMYIFFPVNFSV